MPFVTKTLPSSSSRGLRFISRFRMYPSASSEITQGDGCSNESRACPGASLPRFFSGSSSRMEVRRAASGLFAKRAASSSNSPATTESSFFAEARIPFHSAMAFSSFFFSLTSASYSSPTSRERRISRIASAWRTEKPNRSTSPAFASATLFEARISATISSRISSAFSSPSTMCSLASSRFRRNSVLRRTISRRWPTKQSKISLSVIVRGAPPASASRLPPKVPESCVAECISASTALGSVFFCISTTTRSPVLSDSSRTVTIPSTFFSSSFSAICATMRDFVAPYGISVTTTR